MELKKSGGTIPSQIQKTASDTPDLYCEGLSGHSRPSSETWASTLNAKLHPSGKFIIAEENEKNKGAERKEASRKRNAAYDTEKEPLTSSPQEASKAGGKVQGEIRKSRQATPAKGSAGNLPRSAEKRSSASADPSLDSIADEGGENKGATKPEGWRDLMRAIHRLRAAHRWGAEELSGIDALAKAANKMDLRRVGEGEGAFDEGAFSGAGAKGSSSGREPTLSGIGETRDRQHDDHGGLGHHDVPPPREGERCAGGEAHQKGEVGGGGKGKGTANHGRRAGRRIAKRPRPCGHPQAKDRRVPEGQGEAAAVGRVLAAPFSVSFAPDGKGRGETGRVREKIGAQDMSNLERSTW